AYEVALVSRRARCDQGSVARDAVGPAHVAVRRKLDEHCPAALDMNVFVPRCCAGDRRYEAEEQQRPRRDPRPHGFGPMRPVHDLLSVDKGKTHEIDRPANQVASDIADLTELLVVSLDKAVTGPRSELCLEEPKGVVTNGMHSERQPDRHGR